MIHHIRMLVLPMLVATKAEVEADMSTDPGGDCPDDGSGDETESD